MFGQILQKFAEKSPATVMVRALLEQLLNPAKLDQWFEVTRQTHSSADGKDPALRGPWPSQRS